MSVASLLSGLVPQAHAAPPPINCPGCYSASGDQILSNMAAIVYDQLATIVGAGAVAGMIFAGFMFVYANGDEGKIGKAKDTAKASVLGAGLAYIAGSIVNTVIQYTPSTGFTPAMVIGQLANLLLTIFNTSMVIVIILSGMRMAAGAGSTGEVESGKKAIIWALIGGAVANGAKAIIQLVLQL